MLFALPFVAAGGYIMAISLGILPSDPEAFKAPRLVVAAAGAVFVLGGLMVLLQGSFSAGGQQTTLYKWLEFFVLGGFLLAFAGIFLWVGFGPGERAFQTETTLGPVTTTGDGSPLMGRCLFGTFGLGTLIAALLFICNNKVGALHCRAPTLN
jgi:hypothetical protein